MMLNHHYHHVYFSGRFPAQWALAGYMSVFFLHIDGILWMRFYSRHILLIRSLILHSIGQSNVMMLSFIFFTQLLTSKVGQKLSMQLLWVFVELVLGLHVGLTFGGTLSIFYGTTHHNFLC